MAMLIIQTGKHKGRHLSIPSKEIVIGRDENCAIRLASEDISRRHCTLQATPEGILVRDLGSSNGTFVNRRRINGERILAPGDWLQVGPAEFEVPGVRPPQAAAPQLDNDIADWLTEGDTATGSAPDAGTAIITTVPDASPAHAAHTSAPVSTRSDSVADFSTARPGSRPRSNFRSVGEEARDIIRRHQEWLDSQS